MKARLNRRWRKYDKKLKEKADRAIEMAHLVLGLLSLIPVVGSLFAVADGALYLVDGDYVNASFAFVGAVPLIGQGAKALRLVSEGSRLATALCKAGRWASLIEGVGRGAQTYYVTGSWSLTGVALGLGLLGFFTGGCFVAGTQVIVGIDPNDPTRYITKNIEDLQVGDLVLSRDADDPNAPLVWKPVTETYQNSVQSIKVITVLHEDGTTEDVRTTDQHPFWVESADGTGGEWVNARDLSAGSILVDEDGNAAVVTGIVDQRLASGVTVYNFEVEDTHSYFVADALGNAVWVHNGVCRNVWNSARGSYWKAEALVEKFLQTGLYSAYNLDRMARGRAPQFRAIVSRAGKEVTEVFSMELHHDIAHRLNFFFKNMTFNLRMVTPWQHAATDSYRKVNTTLVHILDDINVFAG